MTTAVATPGTRLIELIGQTPLVRLTSVTRGLSPRVAVLAKAEMNNPGGSVKDRPALAMIRDGIERGRLAPGKTILHRSIKFLPPRRVCEFRKQFRGGSPDKILAAE